jgi:predicted dehydrogenase
VTNLPRLDLNQFTIHPIDSTRFILGDPVYVYGTQAREPGQPQKGETRTISVLEYAGETRAFSAASTRTAVAIRAPSSASTAPRAVFAAPLA